MYTVISVLKYDNIFLQLSNPGVPVRCDLSGNPLVSKLT